MSRVWRGMLALAVMGLMAATCPAKTVYEPDDVAHVIALEDALGKGKALHIHLAVRDGRITAALGTTPRYNKGVHRVDASALTYESNRIRGDVPVTLMPDAYVPKDGKPVKAAFMLDATVEGDGHAGTYAGQVGGEAVKGTISGRMEPHVDPNTGYCRLRVQFFGGLARLFRLRKSSWRYALDMRLTAPRTGGTWGPLRFETIVPDYRRYSAVVTENALTFEPDRLAGRFTARVDYGEQGTRGDWDFREEDYTYELDATIIGTTVGGTYTPRYGDQEATGYSLLGKISTDPPPAPGESIAFIRLHKAMGDGMPVLLTMSLADDGLINGFAYCSGYNHQVHDLDASGLRVEGDRLRGDVAVTIYPDCYKPPEHFTLRYTLDATIHGAEVLGSFTGNDSKQDVSGRLMGELRQKQEAPVPVTLASLDTVTCDLGYALVSGPMPKKDWQAHKPNYLRTVFNLADGKVERIAPVNPSGAAVFSAEVKGGSLQIDGDRLHGDVTFDLTSEVLKAGTYKYAVEAIVDGTRAFGYWRGTVDGEPLYTKSAKLSADLALAAAGASEAAPASGPEDLRSAERAARAAAIRAARATLEQEAAAHGGWEAWGEALDPFQEDLERISKGKWPWPATNDFRFLGLALTCLTVDRYDTLPPGERPFEAIVHFDRELKARGIDLILAVVPNKLSIYPDYLSKKAPEDRLVSLATKRLFARLLDADIEVVDLTTVFRDARRRLGEDQPLYYDRDSHWRNRAAMIHAEDVAKRLKRYAFVQKALAGGSPYTVKPHEREGGAKADFVHLVVHNDTGKVYSDVPDSPIILTGDSFSMYNMHLNGHSPAHVARHIGLPLTFLCKEGFSHNMPVELAAKAAKGFLDGRRVVVWTFAERFLRTKRGQKNWQLVDLPGGPASEAVAPAVRDLRASGVVRGRSAPPDSDAPYEEYIMKFHVTDLSDENGRPVGAGRGVVHVMAMKDHKVLPVADVAEGDRIDLVLTSWQTVEPQYEQVMTGALVPASLETQLPHYWAVPASKE